MFLFLKIENAKFHKFLYLIQYYFIYFIIFLYSWCVYLYKACSKWFHPIYNFVHCFYKTFYYLDTREFSSESCLHFTKIKKKQKGKVCWNQQLVRSNSYKYEALEDLSHSRKFQHSRWNVWSWGSHFPGFLVSEIKATFGHLRVSY